MECGATCPGVLALDIIGVFIGGAIAAFLAWLYVRGESKGE